MKNVVVSINYILVVTNEHNYNLVIDLTFEEFEVAIKQMHPD